MDPGTFVLFQPFRLFIFPRNGQFEMTTSSSNNSYIKDGMLYLVPTLTEDVIGEGNVFDGYVYNLTDCTFNVTQPNNGYIITGDGTTVGSRVSFAFVSISSSSLGENTELRLCRLLPCLQRRL